MGRIWFDNLESRRRPVRGLAPLAMTERYIDFSGGDLLGSIPSKG